MAGDKAIILQQGHMQGQRLKGLDNPPFSGFGHNHLIRASQSGLAQNLAAQAATILGILQLRIRNVPTLLPELRRKFAHCGQDQHNLFRMMRHVTGFITDFGHHD